MGATLLLADRQQNDNLIVYNSGELSRFLVVICFVSTNETVKESSWKKKKKIMSFFLNFSLSVRSETTDIVIARPTRSKLEHYGFNQLPRPIPLRSNKRQTLTKENKTKKIRPNETTPNQ